MFVLEELVGNKSKLAARAGVSNSGIRHYFFENGEPTRPQLIALAQAAGVHVNWLVTGEGPMRPTSAETRTLIVETFLKYRQAERPDTREIRTEFVRAYNDGAVARAAEITNLSLYELNQWLQDYAAPTVNWAEFVSVPFYDLDQTTDIIKNADLETKARSETPISFRRDLVVGKWKLDTRATKLFAVSSEDMDGPFRPRDWVLCDCRKFESPRNGIYLIDTLDGLLFRRIQFIDGGRIRVIRDRRFSYPTSAPVDDNTAQEYDTQEVALIGRVFGYWHRVRT